MPEGRTFPDPIRLLHRPGLDADDRQPLDPFIRLSSDAHPLRAYLACLEVDGRVIVPHLTILMERNEYLGSRTGGARAPIDNRQVERIWHQGLLRHNKTESKSISSTDERAFPAGLVDGKVPRHSPLAWCRKTGAYITPLCPACLGVMGTCRDEVLLRRSGLPSFERNLIRILYCRACSSDTKRPPVFYTYSLRKVDGLAEGVQLRRRSELYRDLGPRIASAEAQTDTSSAIPESGMTSSVGDLHPCFQCEHRASCYPAGRNVNDQLPAEDLLFPLAYYDFYWLPLEPLPLDFHEIVAFLGGAFPADLTTTQADPTAASPLRHEVLAELDRPGNQFFFAGDSTGLFPLESLYLKLSAVAGLARGAQDVLEKTGYAHLALTPDRLRGCLSIGPSILPIRWGLSLKIGDLLTTATPVELEADQVPGGIQVGSFPYPCPEAFLPAGMHRSQVENLWMRLAIEDLRTEKSSGERRAHLQARLTASDLYHAAEHGNHDLVRVNLAVGPAGGQRIVFFGKKTGSLAGGFLFSGSTGLLTEDVFASLESSDLPISNNVEVILGHAFAAPADVMSLGLLMLRLLLSNDNQDTNHLDARQVGALAEAVAGDLDTPDFGARDRLHQAFQKEGIVSESTAILHRQIDRAGGADAAMPSGLWEDTLLLALRMGSNLPDWSICGTQDDYDASDPAEPLRIVVQELDELVERVRGSLIGSAGLNATVQEVCDDFLTDLRGARQLDTAHPMDDFIDQTMVSPPKRKSS